MNEGVILFHCHWQKGPLPSGADVVSWLRARNQLYTLGLIGYDKTESVGYGNISSRVTIDGNFLISGTQTGHIPVLSSEDLSYVTQTDIATNTLHCTGPAKASSESLTHAAIYQQFTEANAVIHVHHRRLWQRLMHHLPTTLPHIGYGTTAMAAEINRLTQMEHLATQKILVMSGHQDGLICFGNNMESAMELLLKHFESVG